MSEGTYRIEEIIDEINELVSEAFGIVREEGSSRDAEAARSYWVGHIRAALGNDDYPTHATTMRASINDIEETAEEEDEE